MQKIFIIDTVRTNNFNDKEMVEKIGNMWQEATKKLAIKEPCELYGLYHNFESDYTGDYDVSVGVKIQESEETIELLEETNYQVFPVNHNSATGVIDMWKEIWKLEEKGCLKRSYRVDFEKYNSDGSIEIYVGLT